MMYLHIQRAHLKQIEKIYSVFNYESVSTITVPKSCIILVLIYLLNQ